MIISENDYIKYMTEQFVTFIDTPQEERRRKRDEQHNEKFQAFSHRWFGILPFIIRFVFKKDGRTLN